MNTEELAPLFIGKLMRIGGMLERFGNKMLMPFELNQQQFSIFFEIGKAGKVKQKDMVNRLSLERAHVSKVIKKLQNMGLIEASQSQDDKRSAWYSPTPKGIEVLNTCTEMFKEWNREWMQEIDEDKYESILESLSILQNTFKQKTSISLKHKTMKP